jgi:hypothetical protein
LGTKLSGNLANSGRRGERTAWPTCPEKAVCPAGREGGVLVADEYRLMTRRVLVRTALFIVNSSF